MNIIGEKNGLALTGHVAAALEVEQKLASIRLHLTVRHPELSQEEIGKVLSDIHETARAMSGCGPRYVDVLDSIQRVVCGVEPEESAALFGWFRRLAGADLPTPVERLRAILEENKAALVPRPAPPAFDLGPPKKKARVSRARWRWRR